DRLLDGPKQGAGGVLYIEGEPGIGKTALVSESIARASERRYSTFSGRAAEFAGDLTLGVFADALEPYLTTLDAADLEALIGDPGPLASGFPALRPLSGEDRAVTPDERHLSLRVARTLLERLGDGRALVIGLDDLHWADPASVDLLCH